MDQDKQSQEREPLIEDNRDLESSPPVQLPAETEQEDAEPAQDEHPA